MATEVKKAIRTATAWTADQTAMEALYGAGNYYTTLALWEAAEQGDLVTADEIRTAECYNDWPSGAAIVTIQGGTTDETRYMKIAVASGHRHDGIDPTSGFFITSSGSGIGIRMDDSVRLFGVAFSGTMTSGRAFYASTSDAYCEVSDCLVVGSSSNPAVAHNAAGRTIVARNCIVIGGWGAAFSSANSAYTTCYNCVAAGCTIGFAAGTSSGVAKNCVAYNCTTNWSGTWSASSTNNATSTGSDDAPGSSSVISVDSADFVDAANNDFHLASGSALIGAGANLYSDFTTDIDGDTWPSSGAWDIGFDYYVAASGAPTITALSAISITATSAQPQITYA